VGGDSPLLKNMNQGGKSTPKISNYCISLLYTLYKEPTGVYNGIERIFQQVQERYYWPKMYKDIRGYVQTCNTCQ